jgi:ABC-2 type transport system permease protein
MSVTAAIVRKDMRELSRDRRVIAMVLLVLVLGLTAIATSFTRVSAYEADRAATISSDRETWEAQGDRNPHSVAHFATWALRPLTAGALLDPGISSYAGSAIWMEAHNQNPARARPIEDQVTTLATGEFSIAWVLQMLMPLLIGVIAAGAVARERERGTLRLILASGGSAARFVSAKLASVGQVTAMIAGGVMVLGVAAAVAAGSANVGMMSLWLLGYAVFLAIIVAIAVGVSARARSTGQALLILVGLWLFAIVLVPRAATSAAEVIAPTPAADQFWTAMSTAMEAQPDPFGDDADAFGQAMARRYGVATVEDLPVDFGGLQLEESERLGNIVFDRLYGELNALYGQQRTLLRWGNILSPLPALQNISMALSGTDMPHQLAFQAQAERHRRAMVTELNTDLIENAGEAGFDYQADGALWATIEDFRFVPPATATVLRSIWPDALILLAWLMVAAWFVRRSATRLMVGEA